MQIAHKIILLTLLWLIFFNPGSITNIDTERRIQMANAWWSGTEERILGDKLVINVNGNNYIPYDLGQSMIMLPGDWLGTKLGHKLTNNKYERQQFTEAIISFFIFVPLNLLAVISCFRLLKLLGYSEKLSGLSSIVWLLGTSVLYYTTFPQQNNQILLFVLVSYQTALKYINKEKEQFAFLSGVALGIAFLIRITNILYAIALLIFLVGCIIHKYRGNNDKLSLVFQSFKSMLLWLAGFIPFAILERFLTYLRYDSWTATTTSLHLQIYAKANTLIDGNTIVKGESSDLSFLDLLTKIKPEGFFSSLFSPEKSIFLYDPLVLPCLILLLICWKFLSSQIKWYLIAGILSFLLHLYIYSWTYEWIEHPAWGARYHVTSVHLLLIPLIPLLVRGATGKINKSADVLKITVSWLTKIIIILAISIQLASVVLPSGLEQTQQQLGIGSQFRIVQRIDNIFALLDRERQPSVRISKVLAESPSFVKNQKIAWEILPFRLKLWLEPDSSLRKFIPILFVLWGVIFILAVTTTIWIFID